MKRFCFGLVSAAAVVFTAAAADVTIDTPTSYNSNQTVDNMYVNAKLTVGDTAISTLTINTGKFVHLPGKDGANAQFLMKWGSLKMGGAGTGFRIGQYSGWGFLQVVNCQQDVTLGRVEVKDGATTNASGYVDIRLANGAETSGHWHRTFITKILNYRLSANPSLRILINGQGAALAPWSYSDLAYFYIANEGTKTILEGEGRDIVFINSPWWGTKPEMELLQSNIDTPSRGILRTQGNCSLVFHNTHQSGEAMAKPSYTFALGQSTNQLEWAHTGPTVISNACILATKADYALPNGPQTGPIVFTGVNNVGSPWLDLCGTTQLVNGVRDGLGSRTVNSVTDVRSVITNSSDRLARIAVRTETNDTFCVGYLKDRIVLRKEGAGTLFVSKVRFSRNDIEVMAGEMVISNLYDTANVGRVTVSDATLVLDGVTLNCTGLATPGSGRIICRNGARVTGTDIALKDATVELGAQRHDYTIDGTTYTAHTGYFELGSTTGDGAFSLVKTGENLLTYSTKGLSAVGGVDVRSGTLRVGGQLTDDKYWRFTFTKATTTGGKWTLQFKNPSTGAYDVSHTFTPWFCLNRLHLWGEDALTRVNHTIGYQGKDLAATALTEGKTTYNAFPLDANGLGGGGQLRVAQIFTKMNDWYAGSAWTNTTPISAENPFVVTFRLQSTMKSASGYAMSQCVNSGMICRPQSWKVESSANGVNWTTRDERNDTEAVDSNVKVYGNNAVPFLFASHRFDWTFKPTGPVKVDAGATLDLTEIPNQNIEIGALAVDFATKGGMVTNAVLATSGYVDLRGVSEGDIDRQTDLGLTFAESQGLQNVASWKVRVNGTEDITYSARIGDDGKLYVSKRRGSAIRFR